LRRQIAGGGRAEQARDCGDLVERRQAFQGRAVGASALEIKKKALETGMITLRRSGLIKCALGLTTLEEVVRETVL